MKLISKAIIFSLAASTLFSWRAEAQIADYGRDNGILSFEDGVENATAGKGSRLSVSDEHNKLGHRSLMWEWNRPKAEITIKGEVPYLPKHPNPKEKSVSSFVFWVYSPQVLDGDLRFSFLKNGKECCHFTYKLGFAGWRGAWVAFDRDMQGTPETGMDEIRISASKDLKKGRLYLDGIIPSSFQDIRHHTPDWQAPFINEKTTNHWLVLNKSWKLNLDIQPKEALTPADIRDMDTVKRRFIRIVTEDIKPFSLKKAREIYGSYCISTNPDGTIKGKPIYFTRYGETFINLGITDAKKTFNRNGQLLRTLNDRLLRIAVAASQAQNPEEKAEFTKIYIDLTRHLLDQGFAAGSAQGTLHHLGYSMRNFYTGPVIMQEALREAGLDTQVQQAMEWFSGVGEIKVAPSEPGMDIDAFNTSLMGRMASVLMLEDTPYKYAYMQALSRWIDNGMKYTEGLRPCFKRDGSVIHHRKSYPAYAVGGFEGAVNAVWMLSRTGLAISEESHGNLKQALLAMKFYCYGDKYPLAMSGRHPDGKGSLARDQFFRLAMAGSPDGMATIDSTLAGAYLALPAQKARNPHRDKLVESFEGVHRNVILLRQNGIKKASARINETKVFGFNCSMSHRYKHRLVTVAGHSRYIWSAEIYNQANHYGRYLTHGSMQVGGGFSQEGWDWRHIPGTTAAWLPMKDMKADVRNVDEFSGYEEMLLSDEWFAGGVTHKGVSGAFAMKLHEHDKYNGTLKARKSFFTIENRIICLGSDIENSLEGAPVHTTLFQNHVGEVTPKMMPNYINKAQNIITSHSGELYIVKGAEVQFYRGHQTSRHEETDAETVGAFEKAYIDHGDIVKGGRYEYMCMLPCTTEEMKMVNDPLAIEEYAAKEHYSVLRHDTDVHGIYDRATGIRAFAVFEEGDVDETILGCSPAMVMYSTVEGVMTLSVCNPDLALYEGPADEVYDEYGKRVERSVYGRTWIDNPCEETTVRLRLAGEWEISDRKGCDVSVIYDQGQTILTFKTKEARTEEVTLCQK
ncbi:MAG: sugar lyase [Bacteroidales bacterium]|nr:sugar lyase [Bacteroidales bacterium]